MYAVLLLFIIRSAFLNMLCPRSDWPFLKLADWHCHELVPIFHLNCSMYYRSHSPTSSLRLPSNPASLRNLQDITELRYGAIKLLRGILVVFERHVGVATHDTFLKHFLQIIMSLVTKKTSFSKKTLICFDDKLALTWYELKLPQPVFQAIFKKKTIDDFIELVSEQARTSLFPWDGTYLGYKASFSSFFFCLNPNPNIKGSVSRLSSFWKVKRIFKYRCDIFVCCG